MRACPSVPFASCMPCFYFQKGKLKFSFSLHCTTSQGLLDTQKVKNRLIIFKIRQMRGRLSSSKERCSMDIDKVDKAKEDLRDGGSTKNSNENEERFSDLDSNQQQQQQPQHRKQIRRRLHTSKPYQERLLNMAEARREIVTALKFHRASMKQHEVAANSHDLHLDQSPPQPPSGQEKKSKSRKNLSLYPSNPTMAAAATTTATFTNSHSSLSSPPPVPYYWPITTIAPPPPPSYHDNVNFVLPSQTLGLNLNFQNFNNLDTCIYHKPSSMYSASSASTSSTLSTSSSTPVSMVGKPKETVSNSSGGGSLHHAMDDEEMEEIRSLGEQHQIEWNDTINLMTSARWCSFLKNMEIEREEGDGFSEFHQFDQAMEFPPWLINANETSLLQHNFDDHFSDEYSQDPALPCMDIGEIEGMDGEWLA